MYTDTGYYVKDTRSGVAATTYTLWRKTSGVSAPTVFRPAKLSGSSISEMSDAEINQYLSYVITNKFAADTDGTGTAELNVDTANALTTKHVFF